MHMNTQHTRLFAILGMLLLAAACQTSQQAIPFERNGAVSFTGKEEMGTIMLFSESTGQFAQSRD